MTPDEIIEELEDQLADAYRELNDAYHELNKTKAENARLKEGIEKVILDIKGETDYVKAQPGPRWQVGVGKIDAEGYMVKSYNYLYVPEDIAKEIIEMAKPEEDKHDN